MKTPTISYNSKLRTLLKKPVIKTQAFMNYTKKDDINKYQLSKDDYNKKLSLLLKPEKNYLVSGKIKNKIVKNGVLQRKSNYKRNYSFSFKARDNLNDDELKTVIFNKLREYFIIPRNGNSSNNITGFSYNLFNIPINYKYNKNVKLFELKTIESKLMNKYSENIDLSYNCVIDYLYHELKKINKKVNKELIIKRFSEITDIKNGISIKTFEIFMDKYHKKIKYIILSPYFDSITKYEPNYRYDLQLTFYCNNNHLYPIQDLKTQTYISKMLTKHKNFNFFKYFKETEITKNNDYIYMVDINEETHEENKTYILNESLDINNFCMELINKYNFQPDYIDVNYNSSTIQSFKHPTKNIIYEAYDDYHKRQYICKQLNNMFDNEFINFNNQSYGVISKTLINYIDDIPISNYIEETYNYLEDYEPKPIIHILTDEIKEEIMQVDYYKQYSSIFYNDFEKYEIQIPIYDYFNVVEDYDNKPLKIGEYYVEQLFYKGVKLFGCFLNYKIVEILLNKNIIKQENIKKQITTQKYFTPSCFKEFVNITSNFEEKEFKKLNNILNGVLKDSKIRNTTSYFTNDINTLCYIYNKSINNNSKINWIYDEKTNYHFIKETQNKKKLSNTSSFYRSTLSCSILQTINLIDIVSDYGTVCKVLTDAVYYKPFKTSKLIKTDEKNDNILKNLGKFYYDICESDIFEHSPPDKKFIEQENIKKSTFIKGSGGLGKTYTLIEKLKDEEDKNILFTSFTNDACCNLHKNINKIIGYIPDGWKIETLTRAYMPNKKFNFDLIIIDEALTTPDKYIRRLEQNDIKKIYLGDEDQMHQVFIKYQQEHNLMKYFNRYCIIENKKFIEGKARYNKETYNILENFKNFGKTKELLKFTSDIKKDKIYKCNIAYTNKKVFEINNICCNEFHKDGEYFNFELKTEDYEDEDGNITKGKTSGFKYKYKIGPGCPLRCESNNKELFKMYGINTAWRGKIKEITKDEIILKGVISTKINEFKKSIIHISKEIIKAHFTVAYCMTAHKWQGQTIKNKYAIHETDYYHKYLSRNFIYTAISRTGDIKKVHIDKSKVHKFYNKWEPEIKFIKTNKKKETYNIYKTKDNIYTLQEETENKKNIFHKGILCSRNHLKLILENLNYNNNNQIKKEKEYKQMVFKPIIEQNRKTVINVYENKIKCLYYDEKEQPKYKTLNVTKKRNILDTFNIILKEYPNAIIKDKKKLIKTI